MKLIQIVGAPGTGKSYLREHLANATGLPSYAIDDERRAALGPGEHWPRDDAAVWRSLTGKVARHEVAIVETAGMSVHDRFPASASLVIETVADTETRRARLMERSRTSDPLVGARPDVFVYRLLQLGRPRLRAAAVVDTRDSATVERITEQVRKWAAN